MKTKFCPVFLLLFLAQATVAQNQWAWMTGEKSPNIHGVYGTPGAAQSSNSPGSRIGASYWTDAQGNLWLFGGRGNGENSDNGPLNDLWKYNPSDNQWTWMGGDKNTNSNGTYGIIGISLPVNQPGARDNAVSWTDRQGNFWLFGGSGLGSDQQSEGLLNDLWKYSPSGNLWTWISGTDAVDEKGKYGKQAEASILNYPGGRSMAAGWMDDEGNLWLFGGWGHASKGEVSNLNDVWKYSPADNSWTWMRGDKTQGATAHYGEQNNFSSGNTPGGRQGGISWTDKQGKFWLYGGDADYNLFTDLWKYDPAINQWAWVGGSKSKNLDPHFNDKGVPDVNASPGSRTMSASWVDNQGELWLFGGYGYGASSTAYPVNSFWKYSIATKEWTFVNGENSNPTAVYGTKGTEAPGNHPGGIANSARWKDNDGNFWLFGGISSRGNLNQTWKFSFKCDANITGTIIPASASICENGYQELTATGGSSYEWSLNNTVIAGQNKAKLIATEPGTYSVNITNGNCNGPASNTAVITLATVPTGTITPASSSICEGGSQELTATGGNMYEWKLNDVIIAGQTQPKLIATKPGTYSVNITNGNCNGPASNTAVISLGSVPNGTITPAASSICEGGSQVLTATGGASYEWKRDGVTIDGETTAALTVTTPGTYSVIVINGGCSSEALNRSVVTLGSTAGSRYADVKVTANIPARLSARPIGTVYEWIPATGLDNPSSATPTVTTSTDIQYLVRITPAEGCEIIDTVQVKVGAVEKKILVPTAFTPNGNNVNDRLRPVVKLSAIDYFRVYNRWGNLVFETKEIGDGWDGRLNGILQPSDTYTWILSGKIINGEPVKQSGKTLLIR
jgi:gliding motility-associated-like protein